MIRSYLNFPLGGWLGKIENVSILYFCWKCFENLRYFCFGAFIRIFNIEAYTMILDSTLQFGIENIYPIWFTLMFWPQTWDWVGCYKQWLEKYWSCYIEGLQTHNALAYIFLPYLSPSSNSPYPFISISSYSHTWTMAYKCPHNCSFHSYLCFPIGIFSSGKHYQILNFQMGYRTSVCLLSSPSFFSLFCCYYR